MITRFRNFTDRLSTKLVNWLCPIPKKWNSPSAKDIEAEHLRNHIGFANVELYHLKNRIQALSERNTELEQANENLIIQRAEVRKLVDQLMKHFPNCQ